MTGPTQRPASTTDAAKRARDEGDVGVACAWADYRKDYGVPADSLRQAHKAFLAGWQAAREGDQSGVLR